MENKFKLEELILLTKLYKLTESDILKKAIEKEFTKFFLFDINFLQKFTQKDEDALIILRNYMKEIGLIPIERNVYYDFTSDIINMPKEYKTKGVNMLVVDVNFLLSEYKDKDLSIIEKELTDKYGYPVFFIDSSKKNTCGLPSNSGAVYFI